MALKEVYDVDTGDTSFVDVNAIAVDVEIAHAAPAWPASASVSALVERGCTNKAELKMHPYNLLVSHGEVAHPIVRPAR